MSESADALQNALRDRYRFEQVISRTTMASVFRAHDLKHDRAVAIKSFNSEFGSVVSRDRFLREIRLVARFQHPHILPLFDSGEAGDVLYYVMPFVEGETLRARLTRERRLDVPEAVRLTRGILDGLAYAHARGIIHRDVKPENVLLSDGHPLIADFGIARALDSIGIPSVTGTGIVVGTIAYMSPEQASGEEDIDARSDIYSLGCVLFEMLAGEPPFAESTPQAMLAQRQSVTPPSVSNLRGDVPDRVVRTLRHALAVDPRDRFATANDFARDLAESLDAVVTPPARSRARRSVIAALVLIILATFATPLLRPSHVQAAGIAILPLLHSDSVPELALDGDNCARLLYDAFSRWSGIALMNDMVVRDARTRHGGAVRSLKDATAIGRDLGARYVVWGEVAPAASGVDVRTTLFDIGGTTKEVRRHGMHIERNEGVEAAFATLADSLLLGILRREVPPAAIAGTRSFDALKAYASAHSALDGWDLEAAESLFRAATRIDTGYAAAQFELAQVIAWRDGSPEEWRSAALRAKVLAPQLGERQRQLSDALLAIADGEQQRACDTYRALLRRDSLDFDAWFGFGECQSRDRVVVRDPTSPSSFRFRSSQHGAIDAYRRALELAPLFQRVLTSTAYDRVARLLYTEAGQIRTGRSAVPDTGSFAAYPQLDSDTLAFVPYPLDSVYAAAPGTYPATHLDAVDRNRHLLRDLSRRWVASAPRDSRAHEVFALSLENLVALRSNPRPTASDEDPLSEMRTARRLATDRVTQIRTAALEVRLLVKADRASDASRLADSLLATRTAPAGSARYLAAVAALVGRTYTAARWVRLAANDLERSRPLSDSPLPLDATREASALLIFAANANEGDSVRRLLPRVEDQLATVLSPSQRLPVRRNLLDWAVTLAYRDLGITSLHRKSAGGNAQMEIEWAIANKDSAAARERLQKLRDVAARERPGDLGFDAIALDAELHLSLGDSSKATALVRQMLNAVSSSGRQLVEGLSESAGFGRVLALGAQLTLANDSAAARRWSQMYVDLCAGAEGNTRRVLQSMRAIAARR